MVRHLKISREGYYGYQLHYKSSCAQVEIAEKRTVTATRKNKTCIWLFGEVQVPHTHCIEDRAACSTRKQSYRIYCNKQKCFRTPPHQGNYELLEYTGWTFRNVRYLSAITDPVLNGSVVTYRYWSLSSIVWPSTLWPLGSKGKRGEATTC